MRMVETDPKGEPMSKFVEKAKDKVRGLYAEAYEELATLEGVDGMDPLDQGEKDQQEEEQPK